MLFTGTTPTLLGLSSTFFFCMYVGARALAFFSVSSLPEMDTFLLGRFFVCYYTVNYVVHRNSVGWQMHVLILFFCVCVSCYFEYQTTLTLSCFPLFLCSFLYLYYSHFFVCGLEESVCSHNKPALLKFQQGKKFQCQKQKKSLRKKSDCLPPMLLHKLTWAFEYFVVCRVPCAFIHVCIYLY